MIGNTMTGSYIEAKATYITFQNAGFYEDTMHQTALTHDMSSLDCAILDEMMDNDNYLAPLEQPND